MEKLVSRHAHNVKFAGSSPAPATMIDEKKDIEQYFADAIMERPYGFSVSGQHFFLYPVTLGKLYLLQRQLENIEINAELIQKDVSLEALRLAKEKKDECLMIICYHTCKTKEEVFDTLLIEERKDLFEKELSYEDIAALMIIVLTSDKTNLFIHHFGIDKEQDRMNTVNRIKNEGSKNNLVFGGKTQYGTLIDMACERYGWTKQYVVWGIDYTSLRLMLADKVNSMYVTDDEYKKLPASVKNANEDIIKPTKENMEAIMNMNWK